MRAIVRARVRAVALLGLLACTTPARAQDLAAADALFTKGTVDLEAGKYDTACPAFEESQRIDPRAGTVYALGVCRDKQGRIATAFAIYGDYVRLVDGMTTALKLRHHDRAKQAKGRRESLAPEIPELTLTLPPGAPDGVKLVRDGMALTAASLGIAIPVDPGEHIVSVQLGDGPVHEQRITIEKREKKTVVLELPTPPKQPGSTATAGVSPPAGASPPVPKVPPGSVVPGVSLRPKAPVSADAAAEKPAAGGPGAQRIGAIVAAGVGLAGIGLGAAMGALVLDKKGFVDAHCPQKACDAEGREALNGVQTPGLVSTVGFSVGAAGLAAAAVLWLTAPGAPAAPKKGSVKDGNRVTGTLEIGPAGAAVGVKGAF